MPIIPRQPEADEEVIAYWLDKLRWTAEQFAALYCGVNPYALKDDHDWKTRMALGPQMDGDESYQLKVSQHKRDEIAEIRILINDRLEIHDRIVGTPSSWRSKLRTLNLQEPPWIQQIQVPEKDDPVKPTPPPEKPLDTRAQNTLLTIIAALCNYSDIKPDERGAASQIAKLAEEIGTPISSDTVARWLKEIPDALERRKK